jgi:hypothetical protein
MSAAAIARSVPGISAASRPEPNYGVAIRSASSTPARATVPADTAYERRSRSNDTAASPSPAERMGDIAIATGEPETAPTATAVITKDIRNSGSAVPAVNHTVLKQDTSNRHHGAGLIDKEACAESRTAAAWISGTAITALCLGVLDLQVGECYRPAINEEDSVCAVSVNDDAAERPAIDCEIRGDGREGAVEGDGAGRSPAGERDGIARAAEGVGRDDLRAQIAHCAGAVPSSSGRTSRCGSRICENGHGKAGRICHSLKGRSEEGKGTEDAVQREI